MANMIYTLFLIPAGFIANISTLWPGLSWIGQISFVRRSLEAYMKIEFNDDLTFVCPGYPVCPIATAQDALDSFSMGNADVATSVYILLALSVACLFSAYLGLRFVSQKPVQ